MEQTPASPQETRAVQQTVVHLRARVAAAEKFRAGLLAKPGSPIAADFAKGHGQDVVSHGLTWMLSADGHLLTLAAAFSTGELHAYGPYSLLRGAAEPLARFTWLFDDSIGSAQRHQRLLGERLENQIEQHKIKALRDRAKARIDHISKLAAAAGFVQTPATGRPAHFGQPRPATTVLFARLLADAGADPAEDHLGELLYRLLSGHAHSVMYALMSQADTSGPRDGAVKLARIELNIVMFLALLDPVIRMYDAAQEHWSRMHGLAETAWRTVRSALPPTADLGTLASPTWD